MFLALFQPVTALIVLWILLFSKIVETIRTYFNLLTIEDQKKKNRMIFLKKSSDSLGKNDL